jgi:hypothetical protein
MAEFKPFDKIARLNRDVVITEKLDGTNGLIYVDDDFVTMQVGSRTRWITPKDDNFGFARWAEEHREELLKLGPGYHYGEWWGHGIQRRYGLTEKRFSLFNVHRWENADARPACCGVVPTIGIGPLRETLDAALERLRTEGSIAAPGFMKPEGVVIYHVASQELYKVTLEGDEKPKGSKE